MSLLLRLNKAAPLTNAETDNNFIYLESLSTSLASAKLSTTSLLTELKLVDGIGSGLDADRLQGYAASDQAVNNSIVQRDAFGNFVANQITATIFVGSVTSAITAQNVSGIIAILNGGTGTTSINAGYVTSNGTFLSNTITIPGSDILGNITGMSSNVTGIVPLANGGTGSNSIPGAQMSLGLVPGQTIQTYSSNLQSISAVGTTGLLFITPGSASTRVLTFGSCLNISNPGGVGGNPIIELTVVDIAHGGTGANNAKSACLNIGAALNTDTDLHGIPKAPTAIFATKTTQIATTEFVINNGVPTASIFTNAAPLVPNGYLQCNGQLVMRALYPALFIAIGTRFGIGNGTTTFQLPNISTPVGFISIIKT